jgi:hypothetical protein
MFLGSAIVKLFLQNVKQQHGGIFKSIFSFRFDGSNSVSHVTTET